MHNRNEEDKIEEVETVIEDLIEPTHEERVLDFTERLDEIEEYVKFINTVKESRLGDVFMLAQKKNVVVKITENSHDIDTDIYAMIPDEEDTESEELVQGKWLERKRYTQVGLDNSIKFAIQIKGNIEESLAKLAVEQEELNNEEFTGLEEGVVVE